MMRHQRYASGAFIFILAAALWLSFSNSFALQSSDHEGKPLESRSFESKSLESKSLENNALESKAATNNALINNEPQSSKLALETEIVTASLPYHEQILEMLAEPGSVLPSAPDVHPVTAVYNREAVIPPQCYTQTESVNNPCYVCHQNEIDGRENKMNDGMLQAAYSFSDLGLHNHWRNLFEDRTQRVNTISDEEIVRWTSEDNYSPLAAKLKEVDFEGWIPDMENLHLAQDGFDQYGFALDNSHWVAFNYKPLPSTFWPANGAIDDVMIRLPAEFRRTVNGEYSVDVYRANLAILEASIKGFTTIGSLPVDEAKVGQDVNGDGKLEVVEKIVRPSHYVGAASNIGAPTYLYPTGTEFMHTVRYLGISDSNEIVPSTRLKEVRYMRKWRSYDKKLYARYYELESFEKEAGNLPGYQYLGDYGLDNGFGWSVQGFIEDRKGDLRVATYEENLFCMGCHKSVGSTIDKTYSFARKVDGMDGWGYIDLTSMKDVPNHGEEQGEFLTYFQRAGGGDEFRSNMEIQNKWFKEDGTVDVEKVTSAKNIYELITPSVDKAMQLNKAYRTIVDDQDFVYGRDARVLPPENVYREIDNETSPTLKAEHIYEWDIRLDWGQGQ